MQHQQVAKRLDEINAGFENATRSLAQIFEDLALTRRIEIPSNAPQCTKLAASAALVSDMEQLMREASNPDLIQVGMQLAKIGDRVRYAFAGGAVLSQQEQAWIQDPANSGRDVPPNLFYILAQRQLAESGALAFDYADDPAVNGFDISLRKNLIRELGEELGAKAAQQVSVGEFMPGMRLTTLATLKLPDMSVARSIADALSQVGVTIDQDGTLRGIFTTVSERVAVAHAPLADIARYAENNTEAKGVRVRTLRDLLELAKKTADSKESFTNFKAIYGDGPNYDGIRNPSTTWGLALLARWIRDRVIEMEAAEG
jgi:hypothetical protein